MSSILDALRKLETEQNNRDEQPFDREIDEGSAEEELVRQDFIGQRITLRLSPLMILVFGGLFAVITVVVAVVAAIVIVRPPTVDVAHGPAPEAPPAHPSAAPITTSPTPSATPAADLTVPTKPPFPVVTPPQPASAAAIEKATAPQPEASPVAPPASRPPAQTVEPVPTPVTPTPAVASAPAPEPAAPVAQPEVSKSPTEGRAPTFRAPEPVQKTPVSADAPSSPDYDAIELSDLPRLSEYEKARLGLSGLRINMTRPASESRPQASAIFNMTPVYVGERIPDTNARLIGVEMRGVGLEMINTGARYYLRF